MTTSSTHGNALILLLARISPLVMALSIFGALAHDAVGTAAASVSTVTLLPLLAGLATMRWISRGDSSDLVRALALRSAVAVAVVSPALALPGTVLGWVGVCVTLCAAAVASSYAALRREF